MAADLHVRVSPSVTAPRPRRSLLSAVPGRTVVALAGALLVTSAVPVHNPMLVLCGLVLSTTALLLRRMSWDLAVPAAALGLLAVSTTVGVGAGLIGLDLLSAPRILLLSYCTYGWGVVALVRQSSRAVPCWTRPAPAGGFAWLAYSGAAVAAAIALAQSITERLPAAWAFAATDFAEHLLLVEDVQRTGSLDYSVNGYPRAFHLLAAFVSVPSPVSRPVDLLGYDMRLVAALTWLSLALVIWAAVTLILRAGAAFSMPRLVAVGGALLFGAGALLTNTFLAAFVYMGAAPSLLAISVLLSLPMFALGLAVRHHHGPLLPLHAAVSVMLLAHLWQPLVVVPPIALLALALPSVWRLLRRSGNQHVRRPSAQQFWVAALASVMLAVAVIPLVSVQSGGGIGLASTEGSLTAVPWAVAALGLGVAVWLPWASRRGWTRLFAGSVAGLLVVVAVMLRGADHGFDLTQYYPMKALWFLVVVLGPLAGLLVVDVGWRVIRPAWDQLARLGRSARVTRVAVAATVGALGFAFVLPQLLGNTGLAAASLSSYPVSSGDVDRASFGPVSAERFDIATAYGSRYAPSITVPVALGLSIAGNANGSNVISKLISFQTGQPQTMGIPSRVCSDVETATAGGRGAVVLTQMDRDKLLDVMDRHGCGDVRVVQLPGGLGN